MIMTQKRTRDGWASNHVERQVPFERTLRRRVEKPSRIRSKLSLMNCGRGGEGGVLVGESKEGSTRPLRVRKEESPSRCWTRNKEEPLARQKREKLFRAGRPVIGVLAKKRGKKRIKNMRERTKSPGEGNKSKIQRIKEGVKKNPHRVRHPPTPHKHPRRQRHKHIHNSKKQQGGNLFVKLTRRKKKERT